MSKPLTQDFFEHLCKSRKHKLISYGNYTDVKCKLEFKCYVCGHEWSSTAASYINSKNGCWGCKKKKISLTHEEKLVSKSTREMISKKATNRTSHWHQLTPENWHRSDTLYLIIVTWKGRDYLKIGRSYDGASYHRGRLKHIIREWKDYSFWIWWVEKMVKDIFKTYKCVEHGNNEILDLPGYSEGFIDELDSQRIILVVERFISRQSKAKP
jgi:hypothetical protein